VTLTVETAGAGKLPARRADAAAARQALPRPGGPGAPADDVRVAGGRGARGAQAPGVPVAPGRPAAHALRRRLRLRHRRHGGQDATAAPRLAGHGQAAGPAHRAPAPRLPRVTSSCTCQDLQSKFDFNVSFETRLIFYLRQN